MEDPEHFNGLNPAQHELITKVGEEATEAAQAAFKVLLHGLESTEPGTARTNRERLEHELGDLLFFMQLADDYKVIRMDKVFEAQRRRAARKNHYLHHVEVE